MKITKSEDSCAKNIELFLKFCIVIHLDFNQLDGLSIKINGWALGQSEIYKLIYSYKKNSFEIPVCFPRPDVYELMNSNQKYPFGNAFFCGIFCNKNLLIELKDMENNLHHNLDFTDRNKKIIFSMPFQISLNEKITLSI